MSNKGATKKTGSKDEIKTRVRSKPKTSSSDGNAETSKKSDSNFPRKSQPVEHRGDSDRGSKSLQNTLTRTHSTRNTTKPSVGSSQVKTVKQVSSTSKSSLNASSSHSLTKSTTSKKLENATKSSDDSTVKKRKSREQVGYSEKRGQSTIYVPQSTASKRNTKSNEKIAHRSSRDKEKLQDYSASDRNKPRISSSERRKSRTLSPSEIRMLHSAVKRPGIVEKTEQKKNVVTNSRTDTQADLDETNYDYEDDFEVRKKKKGKDDGINRTDRF